VPGSINLGEDFAVENEKQMGKVLLDILRWGS